tara:strand:+ start:2610 stop:2762 length:153 start_codon:yes stop_codon:yes gene_type:complete
MDLFTQVNQKRKDLVFILNVEILIIKKVSTTTVNVKNIKDKEDEIKSMGI